MILVMKMQTSRLFEIIYILLNKKSVTAREIAEHFDVSTKTIYRDIDRLSLAGIPVYTEKGKGGGISLLPNFVLSKSILNEKEQNEILSALKGLSLMQITDTGHVLQKLSALFDKSAINWLEIDFSAWGLGDGNLFESFKTAILERRIAEFYYYSSFEEESCRRVEPIQICFKSKAWYIKCFCLARQGVRLFKLTRMKNLTITNETFEERNLPLDACAAEPAREEKQNIHMRFKIMPEMTFRVLDEFGCNIEDRQPDGSFIVSVNCPDDSWIYSFILSFGEYLEVLEPKHVREAILAKAKKISQIYNENI